MISVPHGLTHTFNIDTITPYTVSKFDETTGRYKPTQHTQLGLRTRIDSGHGKYPINEHAYTVTMWIKVLYAPMFHTLICPADIPIVVDAAGNYSVITIEGF